MPEFNNLSKGDVGPLRALQSEIPPTRMALVRQLWSDIDAALKAGHRLTEVHQRLVAGDFHMPYRTLVYCVNRIRLEQARTVPSLSRAAKTSPPKHTPKALPQSYRDPLAQALEACAKPRYDVNAAHCHGDPSKKKLI